MKDKPADYALGSLESRTAARTMLERIGAHEKQNVIRVRIECIGGQEATRTFEVCGPKKYDNR